LCREQRIQQCLEMANRSGSAIGLGDCAARSRESTPRRAVNWLAGVGTESVLRLEVAGLAAIETVKVTVLHQADIMLALAQDAISLATAIVFRLLALGADVLLGHD